LNQRGQRKKAFMMAAKAKRHYRLDPVHLKKVRVKTILDVTVQ